MRYEYECPVHGEIELDHPITTDRKKQRCRVEVPAITGPVYQYVWPCDKPLKPLISKNLNYATDGMVPFLAKTNLGDKANWPHKEKKSWKEETVRVGSVDPVAVGSYHQRHRTLDDLKKGR